MAGPTKTGTFIVSATATRRGRGKMFDAEGIINGKNNHWNSFLGAKTLYSVGETGEGECTKDN